MGRARETLLVSQIVCAPGILCGYTMCINGLYSEFSWVVRETHRRLVFGSRSEHEKIARFHGAVPSGLCSSFNVRRDQWRHYQDCMLNRRLLG